MMSRGLVTAVAIAAGLLLASALSVAIGPAGPQTRASAKQLRGDWKRRSIPSARLSAELPTETERAQAQLSGAAKKAIDSMSAARLIWEGVLFRFAFSEYGKDASVDLGRAADAAVANLKRTATLTELQVKRSQGEVNDTPFVLVEATYQYLGSPVSYRILIAGKGNRLWQASALYKTTDADQEAIAKRVLDSVRLEK
jgi:hypothetical protein